MLKATLAFAAAVAAAAALTDMKFRVCSSESSRMEVNIGPRY